MRIGIYDPYLDDMGGGEKYMLSIASCLSKNNEVSIFWDKKSDLDAVLSRFKIDLSKIKVVGNIFSKHVFLSKRLLESKKYDVIIVLSDGGIPVLLSKKLFIHIQQPLPFVHTNVRTKIKLSRVSQVFVNSQFTKNFVDRELGVDSLIIYPPVDLKPRDLKKENIILHVGRFRVANVGVSDYKKQSVMLGVFKKMINNGLKNWKFVIASGVRNEDLGEFEKMKKTTDGYPIEFMMNKSNDELWEIYSKAKIYWHASGFGEDLKKHPEFSEHFGISTVEAMGAGAVPVVINAGGQKEIIDAGFNGYLWDTLEELENYTLELIAEPKKLVKMSKEVRKRADYFAGDRFCSEIQKMVNS